MTDLRWSRALTVRLRRDRTSREWNNDAAPLRDIPREVTMRIRFHGPIDEVTGSCYELIDEQMRVHLLVDCGLVQGERDAEARNRRPFPFDAKSLTHVVLTHAHADHSGLLPRLYAEGYTGSVFCTTETAELARIVQRDAARFPGAAFKDKHIDLQKFHEPGKATLWGTACPIANNLFLRFFRSGHIVGATSVTVLWGPRDAQRSITFSGDLGPNVEDREVLPLLGYRQSPHRTDYAVIESTYGDKVRAPVDTNARLARLHRELLATLRAERGVVIIPCFSLERLQDLLCDLTLLDHFDPELLAGIPVVLDSPLGNRANGVIAKAFGRTDVLKDGARVRETWLGRGLFRALGLDFRDTDDAIALRDAVQEMLVATAEPTAERRARLPRWRRIWTPATREGDERGRLEGPAIVITGSGMCDGGPVQDYLRRLLPDPSTKVLLTGFCGVQTVGGALQKIAGVPLAARSRVGGDLKLGGQTLPMRDIRATVAKLEGYSAHADQAGLVDWLWNAKPGEEVRPIARKLFISHGARQAREGLRAAVMARAEATQQPIEVELPDSERWFDLDAETWLVEGRTPADAYTVLRRRIAELRAQIERSVRSSGAEPEGR